MNNTRHFLIVLSGPSGAGKSSLAHLLAQDPSYLLSVSCTTRQIRPGEQEGREYYFLSREAFEKRIQEKQFLEYAKYDGNYYGTLLSEIDRILPKAHCVLDIDVQGAKSIRAYPELRSKSIFLFIEPPNLEEQIQRLRSRGNNADFNLDARLQHAQQEMQEKHLFDHTFVNHDLKKLATEVNTYLNEKFLAPPS